MSDLRIPAIGPTQLAPLVAPRTEAPGAGFGEALRQALHQVNQTQLDADQASQDFSVGRTKDVASTLIAVEKANLAFQLTLQVRNKLLEAYQEVMRMQV
jgi:flagellar hook-basal body complex protein FliE